jgi:hypothetical protein
MRRLKLERKRKRASFDSEKNKDSCVNNFQMCIICIIIALLTPP